MMKKYASNKNEFDLQTFLIRIATGRKSPRMGHAGFYLLKDRWITLSYTYYDTVEREVKYFCYNFPKHNGQIAISRKYYFKTPNVAPEMFKMTTII